MRRAAGLAALMLATSLFAAASSARQIRYALPEEHIPAELRGADAEPVVANCSGCHSLDYITTQPRGKGPQFWRDTVSKMINVYKAPVEPAEADKVATELGKRLG